MNHSRIVIDRGTGRPILVCPNRRQRLAPGIQQANAARCPFCAGNEHETNPEIDAIRLPGTAADGPGWVARAFSNRYPATELHEVIVEGTLHADQPGALAADLWADVLSLYRRRMASLESRADVRCTYLFKNVGRDAGASVAHNHSQILGLPMLPPRLDLELQNGRRQGFCLHCEEIEGARRSNRVVLRGERHVVITPSTPKLAFETWLLPEQHDADFLAGNDAVDLARTLQRLFRTVEHAFATPSFNFFWHRIPGEDFHWHCELQPRVTGIAGLEVGGDMYMNPVSAGTGAAILMQAAEEAGTC